MNGTRIGGKFTRKQPVLPPAGSTADGFWLCEAEIERRDQEWKARAIRFPSLVVRDPEPEWLYLTAEAADGSGVRGFLMADHAIWWPCAAGTHGDAKRWLNIIPDPSLPHRATEIEFHLVYANETRRSGRVLGSYFTATDQDTLDRLLHLPSIAPYLNEDLDGLRSDAIVGKVTSGRIVRGHPDGCR
jgi:hypothetical protein